MVKLTPIVPTPTMIEDGAQRLVSWEEGCVWPDSWDSLQVAAARNDAERVWRSMWLAAAPSPSWIPVSERLQAIHSALDDALGDTDVDWIETDEEMRGEVPVQWAATELAKLIQELETPPTAAPVSPSSSDHTPQAPGE